MRYSLWLIPQKSLHNPIPQGEKGDPGNFQPTQAYSSITYSTGKIINDVIDLQFYVNQ